MTTTPHAPPSTTPRRSVGAAQARSIAIHTSGANTIGQITIDALWTSSGVDATSAAPATSAGPKPTPRVRMNACSASAATRW